MFPNVNRQYRGILQLLLHFQWRWIGVLYDNDDNGERFVQNVVPMFSQKGICFDFIERFPIITFVDNIDKMVTEGFQTYRVVTESTANVSVIYGDIKTMVFIRMFPTILKYENITEIVVCKVWVMSAQMEFTSLPFQKHENIDFLHGALSFAIHSRQILGFQEFLHMRKPILEKEGRNGFIRPFWEEAFECLFPGSTLDSQEKVTCTGVEKLETLLSSVFETSMTAHSYSIYNSVYVVAHALYTMLSLGVKRTAKVHKGRQILLNQLVWKVIVGAR